MPFIKILRIFAKYRKTLEDINLFKRNYEGKLATLEDFTRALYEIEQIYIEMSHIDNYSFMPQTSDFSNEEFAQIAQAGADFSRKPMLR